MQFPFETTTKDGRKATVLGTMPNGRLAGFIKSADGTFISWHWNADGSGSGMLSIALPLQIKPLTTYRMRNGGIAWTSGLVRDGWIFGLLDDGTAKCWRAGGGKHPHLSSFDLIEELPPGTTE